MSRTARIFAVVAVLSLVSVGCSMVGFAYNRLDWLAMNYIDDRFELEPATRKQIADALSARLDAHRTNELSEIITLLNRAEAIVRTKPTRAAVRSLIDDVGQLYVDTLAKTIPHVVPVLASLEANDAQRLADGFDRLNDEFADRYQRTAGASARQAARFERLESRFRFWAGAPREDQIALITETITRAPDPVDAWYEDRLRQQSDWLSIVRNEDSPQTIEAVLREWWVSGERRNAELEPLYARTRSLYTDLMLALIDTFSEKQTKRILSRIESIRDSLQENINQAA
ncbi:MAG: DUF6279 family lipoprotein [Pseudomonadota bacterium]